MQIKTPIKELTAKQNASETAFKIVSEKLKNDPANGYTILGLMVECFNVKQSDIENKPFKDWKKGYPSLYTRIRASCEKLKKQGLVGKTVQKRAFHYFWLSENPLEV